jgi:hypothetical protein
LARGHVLFGLGALIDTRILAASGPTETITGTCKQAVEIEAGLKAKGKQPGVGLVPFFLLALGAIAFSIYSDTAMTRCAAASFFAVLGWCSTYR